MNITQIYKKMKVLVKLAINKFNQISITFHKSTVLKDPI